MTRYVLLFLAAIPTLAIADKKWTLYDGPQLKREQIGTFNLYNYPGYLSKIQIYTISIDSHNFEDDGAMGLVPAAGGQALLAPGKHIARISFVDTKHRLFPAFMDSRTFPGWYEIEFEVQPGMIYAPTLPPRAAGNIELDRMCIGSVPFNKGVGAALGDIRKQTDFASCGAPTLDPKIDRESWCRSWDGTNSRPIICRHPD